MSESKLNHSQISKKNFISAESQIRSESSRIFALEHNKQKISIRTCKCNNKNPSKFCEERNSEKENNLGNRWNKEKSH